MKQLTIFSLREMQAHLGNYAKDAFQVCGWMLLCFWMLLFISGCDHEPAIKPEEVRGIELRDDPFYGSYLADDKGQPLYFFSNDVAGKKTCTTGCDQTWKPFYLSSLIPFAGAEIPDKSLHLGAGLYRSLFKEIQNDDGTFQVAYKGWPLYTLSADLEGQISGDGTDGIWYVARPDYSVMIANDPGGIGKYLCDDYGRTLYTNNLDPVNLEESVIDQSEPLFFDGVYPHSLTELIIPSLLSPSSFGIISRTFPPDNQVAMGQTTYKGKPLYLNNDDDYKGDRNGEKNGSNFSIVRLN